MKKKVAIVGGGASGFFTAINLAERCPDLSITIYEASDKLLSKVLISGGGRCNLTNQLSDPTELSKQYPRGGEFLEPAFRNFTSTDTCKWFEKRGVNTRCEEDGRIFPTTNSSQTIYDLFLSLTRKLNISIQKKHRLVAFSSRNKQWQLNFKNDETHTDYLILCCSISASTKSMLDNAGIKTTPLVPSLFTFNAASHIQKELSGISVEKAKVHIREINESESIGPLLITHWGYSGPAVLKLSSFAALELNALDYAFTFLIDWLPDESVAETQLYFTSFAEEHPKKKVMNYVNERLPKRLWKSILANLHLQEYTNWAEIGKKKVKALSELLHQFEVEIKGKTTFKEEFVTAGGIALDQLNSHFEIKGKQNLYAIGEVLNIDGVTGGFNFQAAWSGAMMVSNHIHLKEK